MAHFLLFSFSFPFYFFVYTDVFDTLLLRPFVHPFDVFSYLEYFFEPPACMRGPAIYSCKYGIINKCMGR